MIPCFPRHARRIRLEWRTVRSIVKRILVTCAATTALALLLTMVLCALGNAMAPKWQVEPFTDHITLTTTNTAIQAVDPATGAVLKTPQEGAYRTKETHITVALDGGKTVNAIVREPLDAPADRPACLFLHGSGTGKSSERSATWRTRWRRPASPLSCRTSGSTTTPCCTATTCPARTTMRNRWKS